VITSASNPKLRLAHRLLESRRQREKEGLFVCEGEDLVLAAEDAAIDPVELLVAGQDVEPDLLARISTLVHPPRVMGIYRRDSLPRGVEPVSLSLWHVADPGNIGTLLRSADAFGASLALSPGCADITGPKALRASAGAVFGVPTAAFDDVDARRVALVPHEGQPLHRVGRQVPISFVLGAEREGLPDDVVASCDETASIIIGPSADSLNVAMAGTLALYEFRRPE
jgi:RNA methyltransferase, TrmH family